MYKFLGTRLERLTSHNKIVNTWLHTEYSFTWRLFIKHNSNAIVYAIIPNKL